MENSWVGIYLPFRLDAQEPNYRNRKETGNNPVFFSFYRMNQHD